MEINEMRRYITIQYVKKKESMENLIEMIL